MGSVQRHQQGSEVRRGAFLTEEDEMPYHDGMASANEAELDLTENEMQREKRLRRQRLARKRPPGFAPWPREGSE